MTTYTDVKGNVYEITTSEFGSVCVENVAAQITYWADSEVQSGVLDLARTYDTYGVTVRDVRAEVGTASGALSVLHKVGKLARLKEVRNRCAVYVLPEYVGGRETEPHGERPKRSDRARRHATADALVTLLLDPEFQTLVLAKMYPYREAPFPRGWWQQEAPSVEAVALAIVEALAE